jgi:uncharacterized membrane protein YdjX (TVP38/TMEM64 family)
MNPEIKSYKHIISIALGFIITIALYFAFLHSPYFEIVKTWATGNVLLLSFILTIIKIVGIVWPPIPGGLLTLGAIPILGWLPAYLSDLAGSLIGSSIAYYIGLKWGKSFLLKIFDQSIINKIEQIKIREKHELELVFFTRIFGGNIIEAICYGAGVLKIPFHKFLLGTILSHITVVLPFYYFASSIFSGQKIYINILIAIGALIFISIFKKRYLQTTEEK